METSIQEKEEIDITILYSCGHAYSDFPRGGSRLSGGLGIIKNSIERKFRSFASS